MRKSTLAVAALAALGGLAASTAPASAWHRHWHRTTVVVRPGFPVVAPVYPFVAPVVVAPRVVYRAPYRVKRVRRVVVYR